MIVAVPSATAFRRAELRLHVGRERRVRRRLDVDGPRSPAAHVELDPIRARRDLRAGFGELLQHGVEVLGLRPREPHAPTGDGRRDEVRAALDAVRHDVVRRCPCEPCDSLYMNRVGAGAFDLRAHRRQEMRRDRRSRARAPRSR